MPVVDLTPSLLVSLVAALGCCVVARGLAVVLPSAEVTDLVGFGLRV